MFCRAVALEGAFKGLQRYMTPDYTIFYNYKVSYIFGFQTQIWNSNILRCSRDLIISIIVYNCIIVFCRKVWFQAFMQSLFSPGGGFGMYVVLSSYNQLHNNVKKDVIVAISADVLISILGSMIAFMFLGHYSVKAFTPIPEKFPGMMHNIISYNNSVSSKEIITIRVSPTQETNLFTLHLSSLLGSHPDLNFLLFVILL